METQSKPYKEFGEKLKDALKRIVANSSQSLQIVEDYISGALGYSSPATLKKWRQGDRRPNEAQLVNLVRILKNPKQFITEISLESPDLDRPWLEAFVKRAKYPDKTTRSLLKEIFPETETEPVPVLPSEPSSLDEPPDVDLIGRGKELFALQNKLKENNFAILTGMPGIGKTALASTLYKNRSPERRFWYSFQQLAGLSDLINKLASLLHRYGDSAIYQQLNQNRSSSLTMLDQILQKMSGQGYLLCFDNLNHIEDSNSVKQILAPFLQYTRRGEFELLVISRARPLARMDGVNMKPFVLEGLNEDETGQLLSQLNPSGSEEIQAIAHQLTRGNPQFLTLMADILNQQRNLLNLFGKISEDPDLDLEVYIVEEVDRYLDKNERSVMQALSICMEYPATYSLIEEVADQRNLFDALTNLRRRHLLLLYKDSNDKGANEIRYSQHAILQQFYYERISRRDQKAMHLRAAAYYRSEEQNIFKAALHYEKADEFEQAAEYLIGENTWTLIFQGYASAASQLLASLQERNVIDERVQPQLLQSLGTFYRMQAKNDAALQTFRHGFEQANSASEQIQFLYEIVRVYRYQGNFNSALQKIEQIHEIHQRNPALLMDPEALNNIGWVYYRLGNIEEAERFFILAWGDDGVDSVPSVRTDTKLGFGLVAYSKKDFDLAIAHYTESQRLFEEIGDLIGQAHCLNNLGLIYREQKDFDQALDNLEEMLKIFEDIGDVNGHIIGAYNIAITYMKDVKYDAADSYLAEDYLLAEQLQNHPLLCRYEVARGEIAVHKEQLEDAEIYLKKAKKWLEHIIDDEQEVGGAEQGIVHYFSGVIALAQGNFEAASESMSLALPLLEKTHENEYIALAQFAKKQVINGLSN